MPDDAANFHVSEEAIQAHMPDDANENDLEGLAKKQYYDDCRSEARQSAVIEEALRHLPSVDQPPPTPADSSAPPSDSSSAPPPRED